MKKIIFFTSLFLIVAFSPIQSKAATHTVEHGESLWQIANRYGISINQIISENQLSSSVIHPGQSLNIDASITRTEKELLARLVHAEARGESYPGKVAVATVVLNRVDHPDFPNTIEGVIYQRSAGGFYAFTPVQNGAINREANQEALQAVNEAIAFRGQGSGSLYFYNPRTATNDWIRSREVTIIIGNHHFAK
ncbi:cell wall hydrolase [Amphibacillus cookii]|uniref:cell wall hydrolase n=1 Tax=Amphibacillus cookii TaxID=767787 RepID=UPI00195B9F91|nr:cell wall hydrolase [Amphibacillus cookii]MBM7540190.1 N-acetylmuramoyl-L-alanine amidase [Amphibacillus cookii]